MKVVFRKRIWVTLVVAALMVASLYMLAHSGTYYPTSHRRPGLGPGARQSVVKKPNEYVDGRGIRVIVGHYKPDEGPKINFTKDELNTNNFQPEAGQGEGGRPVFLKPHEQIRAKRLFHINEFNLVASDRISLDRGLEDVRSAECRALRYSPASLPTTSIINLHPPALSPPQAGPETSQSGCDTKLRKPQSESCKSIPRNVMSCHLSLFYQD